MVPDKQATPAAPAGRSVAWLPRLTLASLALLLLALPMLSAAARAEPGPAHRQAMALARAGDHEAALATARASGDPLFAQAVLWMGLTEGNLPLDQSQLQAFLTTHPDWPRRERIKRRFETVMAEGLDPNWRAQWFAAEPPASGRGGRLELSALTALGRDAEVASKAGPYWRSLRFQDRNEEALFLASFGHLLSQEDHIGRLERLIWERQSGPAAAEAQRMGGPWPAYTRARLALAAGQGGVDSLVAAVPESLRNRPGFVHDRAAWRRKAGLLGGVFELLERPTPDPDHAQRYWRMRHWSAREAMQAGDLQSAYLIAANHGTAGGVPFAEGEFLAGYVAHAYLGDHETALGHFASLHDGVTSVISRGRGAFWAGEAARAMGDQALAEQWYRTAAGYGVTFYGQIAAQRLGTAPTFGLLPDPAISPEVRSAFEERELTRLARLFGRMGERRYQQIFLVQLDQAAETPEERWQIARLAHELGRPDLALRSAKAARRQGASYGRWLFPNPPLNLAGGVDPTLVYGLIRQESGFDHRANSHADARGLMQLLPSTAERVAARHGQPYSGQRLFDDPAYNIRLGSAYLAEMLQRYRGSAILALAAYNAGPHRVDRWLRENGDPRTGQISEIDWIERIPFGETRNYVQRVLESTIVYRGLATQPLSGEAANPLAVGASS